MEPLTFDNPFCTRRVRPGAIPFHFPEGESAAQLLERLRANNWRGAIIGPHGSGKSTLLAALEPLIAEAGREVVRVNLHDGQRRLPATFTRDVTLNDRTHIIVDGYEQLSRLSRLTLRARCRIRGSGLLVTAHDSVGLPETFRTTQSLELTQLLTRQLLSNGDGSGERVEITDADIASAFRQHRGDLRETLFALYDLYELRKENDSHAKARSREENDRSINTK